MSDESFDVEDMWRAKRQGLIVATGQDDALMVGEIVTIDNFTACVRGSDMRGGKAVSRWCEPQALRLATEVESDIYGYVRSRDRFVDSLRALDEAKGTYYALAYEARAGSPDGFVARIRELEVKLAERDKELEQLRRRAAQDGWACLCGLAQCEQPFTRGSLCTACEQFVLHRGEKEAKHQHAVLKMRAALGEDVETPAPLLYETGADRLKRLEEHRSWVGQLVTVTSAHPNHSESCEGWLREIDPDRFQPYLVEILADQPEWVLRVDTVNL